jgi:lipopolysaccharide/colanic/teichoic acid biosynthesis glycosyltransferase
MASIPVGRQIFAAEDEWTWQCLGAFERILAGLLMASLSPMLVAMWVAVLAVSGRAPLIAHRRVGRNGSDLWVLKFRTMWEGPKQLALRSAIRVEYIADDAGPSLKGPRDARVGNRFARFCRRHSLDELPQLLHVLRGEMSLVGPRPVTFAELDEIYGSKAEAILRVRPGLSGLWQVSGRNRLTAAERCRLDLKCVTERSLKLYFWILLKTIPELLTGTGAW